MGTEDQDESRYDKHSRALWDAFRAPSQQALQLTLKMAIQESYEPIDPSWPHVEQRWSILQRDLAAVIAGTGLDPKWAPFYSREEFISRTIADMTKGNSIITSMQIGGVQHDGPIMKRAAAKYRRHLLAVRSNELYAAKKLWHAITLVADTAKTRSSFDTMRREIVDGLVGAHDAIRAYEKIVRRMQAMTRLGRKVD